MSTAPTTQKAPRSYQKHGLNKRKRAIKKRGIDGIDARTAEGKDALKFRDRAISDLGGDQIPTLKKSIVEVATGERYLWRCGWTFILNELKGNPINKRKKCFYTVAKDVLALGESLIRHAKDAGVERVAKTTDLASRLRELGQNHSPNGDHVPNEALTESERHV